MPVTTPPTYVPGTPSIDPVTPYSQHDDPPFADDPSPATHDDEETEEEYDLDIPPIDRVLWHLLSGILGMRNDSPLFNFLEYNGILPTGTLVPMSTC